MSEKYGEKNNGDFKLNNYKFDHQGTHVTIIDGESIVRTSDSVTLFHEQRERDQAGLVEEVTLRTSKGSKVDKHYIAEVHLKKGWAGVVNWASFWSRLGLLKESMVTCYDDCDVDRTGLRVEDEQLPPFEFSRKVNVLTLSMPDSGYQTCDIHRSKICFATFVRAFLDLDTFLAALDDVEQREQLSIRSEVPDIATLTAEDLALAQRQRALDNVHGMHSIREDIEEVIASHEHPEVMEAHGVQPITSLLLKGEPGVGKTHLAVSIAERLGAEMILIKATDIHEKWVGSSAVNVRDTFERAEAASKNGKVVIVLDEFDGITAGSGNEGSQNAVNVELKDQLAYMHDNCPNVLVIATTNEEEKIDPAIRRSGRFDKVLYIEMPNIDERLEIIEAEFSKIPHAVLIDQPSEPSEFTVENIVGAPTQAITDVQENTLANAEVLAERTEGFSGADIKAVFKRARMKIALQAVSGKEVPPVSYTELLAQVEKFNR